MLDLIASVLSRGRSTHRISQDGLERGVSQVFLAIHAAEIAGEDVLRELVEETIADLHTAAPLSGARKAAYPGEGMLKRRRESLERGVPVDEDFWRQVLNL